MEHLTERNVGLNDAVSKRSQRRRQPPPSTGKIEQHTASGLGAQEAFQQFAEDEQKHLLLLGQIQADFGHQIARGCVGSHDNSVTVQWMTEDGSTPLVPDPLAELTGFESTEELVEMGIELEASSAALYSALQGMVAIETCRQQVEQMAKQERAHLVTLQQLAIAVSQSA